jgi:hypothetical protein
MGPDTPNRSDRALMMVYLLSPMFWLLDAALGWSFRIAGLELMSQRHGYYLALTATGGLLLWQPRLTQLVAVIEPAVNVGILIISTWMSLLSATDAAIAGQTPEFLTAGRLVNFLISGTMLSFAVNSSIARLRP